MKQFYRVEIKMNGEIYKNSDTDLDKAIMKGKPEQVLTISYITIIYKKRTFERMLNLIDSKRLFEDKVFREIFINNLI